MQLFVVGQLAAEGEVPAKVVGGLGALDDARFRTEERGERILIGERRRHEVAEVARVEVGELAELEAGGLPERGLDLGNGRALDAELRRDLFLSQAADGGSKSGRARRRIVGTSRTPRCMRGKSMLIRGLHGIGEGRFSRRRSTIDLVHVL